MEFYYMQIIFLAIVFLFAGCMGYWNYRIQLNLIRKNKYLRVYNQTSDVKVGLLLVAIGIATGVSLYSTGSLNTSANLGFFIPFFAGAMLIIAAFVEREEKIKLRKR